MMEIDINCDVGEGIGNETDLMPLISSCNIACGSHAGDEHIMRETIRLAKIHGVKIGAHPSYPDRENFGRKVMDISSENLISSLRRQLTDFCTVLNEEEGELHHIKPHGALYNEIAKNNSLANTFLDAMEAYRETVLYVPFGSVIQSKASNRGWPIAIEAFADRNYNTDLTLVSRTNENALIQNPRRVLAHIFSMASDSKVRSVQGQWTEIKADTYCVHGDTPSALKILMYLHEELPNHNIQITK
jgi:UPF0271 protein